MCETLKKVIKKAYKELEKDLEKHATRENMYDIKMLIELMEDTYKLAELEKKHQSKGEQSFESHTRSMM